MTKGDFSINKKNGSCHESYFPVSHYHGISIAIVPSQAQKIVDQQFGEGVIDLQTLCNRFCEHKEFYLAQEEEAIEHIFYELYHVPKQIKVAYFKLKVLEVILFLSTLEIKEQAERVYFSKGQVEKVKAIQRQLIGNLDKKYTLEELAKEHEMALTSMKRCFKGVFGTGIYAYIKAYRVNVAAQLLLNTEKSIIEVANCVGYVNGSKFAAAFKDAIGLSPSAFRQSKAYGVNALKKDSL